MNDKYLDSINRERILKELARIAFSDMRDLAEWGPEGIFIKSSEDIAHDHTIVVAELSEPSSRSGGAIKIKRYDKMKALELLLKYTHANKETPLLGVKGCEKMATNASKKISQGRAIKNPPSEK